MLRVTEIRVTFIRLFASQPSILIGSVGGMGRGWPKAIQNKKESAVRAPVIAPFSVATSVPMPRVKTPNSGPPTTPKMVKPACEQEKLWISTGANLERYNNNNNRGIMIRRNSLRSINFTPFRGFSNLLAIPRPIIGPGMPERWRWCRTWRRAVWRWW